MTNNLGFGFDAELDYRQERLRADFRRAHGSTRPRRWQRTPAAAVAAQRTPAAAVAAHSDNAGTVNAGTVEVAPVSGRPSWAAAPAPRAPIEHTRA
ncbi:MAG TPA: hypothetical protein VES60_09965 [Nakamurella sp.]|nr:hypothetical protein [Nakamurella sp.]